MAEKVEQKDYESIKNAVRNEPLSLMKEAGSKEMNFSQLLNASCPTVLIEEKRSVGNKLMEDFGFIPRDSSILKATSAEEFFQTQYGRVLAYDYLYRNHIANYGKRDDALLLPYSNTDTLYPEAQGTPMTEDPPLPRFDPNSLVGIQSNAASGSYNIFRWNPTEDDLKRERVLPGTNIPIMQLTEQEAPITLKKWGIGAELTYESIRRSTLDKIGVMINLQMDVERKRQLSEFIKVLKDGDERDGKKASDGTDLDTKAVAVTRANVDSNAAAGTLTLRGLMAFMAGWPEGRRCTHIICRLQRAIDIALLSLGNNNILASQIASQPGIPGFSIPGLGGNVVVLIADDADIGADEFLGIDSTASLEKVNEVGADIREQAEQIQNQTRIMTFTDTYGLAKVIIKATRLLTIT